MSVYDAGFVLYNALLTFAKALRWVLGAHKINVSEKFFIRKLKNYAFVISRNVIDRNVICLSTKL